MNLRLVMVDKDPTAVLAQVLEDAMGCRAAVACMLLLDLPSDVLGELVACDQDLSRLIAATIRHLGLAPSMN